jgi:pantoate--beta-alanine ligase
MKVFKKKKSIQIFSAKQKSIAFVPTMGNLHSGHIKLIQAAKKKCSCVVVSIFINPTQFNEKSDFEKYPKTLTQDLKLLKKLRIDAVFIPDEIEMHTDKNDFKLNMLNTDHGLCDSYRPGHFEGVILIVSRLCNIIRPNYLFLGKKDYQQLFILKKLIKFYCYPIKVIGIQTIREKSGLAISSRNNQLSNLNRLESIILYKTLQNIKKTCKSLNKIEKIENEFTENLKKNGWIVDYLTIRSQLSLLKPTRSERKLVALVAAKKHNIRLIDNIEFCI